MTIYLVRLLIDDLTWSSVIFCLVRRGINLVLVCAIRERLFVAGCMWLGDDDDVVAAAETAVSSTLSMGR